MWPLCDSPSRLPAPRISRSRIAILKPLPRSVASPIVRRRSYASSVSRASRGWNRYAYARDPLRPTRPRKLVHLAQAQQVGALDDERVDRRHVDAALDDGGAHQHVEAAFPEVDDDLLERTLVHLPVGDGDARLGHQLAQSCRRPRRWC